MDSPYLLNGKRVSREEFLAGARGFTPGQPPAVRTASDIFKGHCNGSQFEKDEANGNYYKAVAEAAGQDVKGKVYLSGLADYPGDPEAWVADASDIRRVVEERGWTCRGAVNVQGPGVTEESVPVRVAPDIVEREVARLVEKDPGLAVKHHPQELREMVVDKHGGPS